jgi:hypothetical protein
VDFNQSVSEPDVINLGFIDAAPNITGDQAFLFIDNASFSGSGVAEVRWYQNASNTFIQADTGDGTADMTVRLIGLFTITAGDLLL